MCRVEGAYLSDVCIADAPKAPDAIGEGLESIISSFQVQGAAREVVHRLKYSRLRVMAQQMERHCVTADIIVPIPLHPNPLSQKVSLVVATVSQPFGMWLEVGIDRGIGS